MDAASDDTSVQASQRQTSLHRVAASASGIIGQAVGVIMARYGFSEAQAVGVLRRLAHDDAAELVAVSDGICRAHAARVAEGRPTVLTD